MYTNGKIGSYVSLSLSANLATAWCQDSCSSSYSSSHYIFGSCHSLWILCSIIFATYMPRKFIFNLTLPIGRIGDPESMDHPKDQPLCLVDWTSRSTHPFLNAPFFSLPPSLFPPFFLSLLPGTCLKTPSVGWLGDKAPWWSQKGEKTGIKNPQKVGMMKNATLGAANVWLIS